MELLLIAIAALLVSLVCAVCQGRADMAELERELETTRGYLKESNRLLVIWQERAEGDRPEAFAEFIETLELEEL